MHATSLSRMNWNCKLSVAKTMHSKTSRRGNAHPQKSKDPKRKHGWSWKRKVQEMKRLEAVAVEMRAELDNMKRGERKAKAKLRKVHRIISQIRNGNRQASNNNSHSQLCIDAILRLLDV